MTNLTRSEFQGGLKSCQHMDMKDFLERLLSVKIRTWKIRNF